MFNGFFTHTKLIGIKFSALSLTTYDAEPAHFRSLLRVALRVEERSSHLCARQVFAIIEVVILASLEIVESNQLTFHGIIELLAFDEHVGAQHDLILLRDEGTLHKAITSFKSDVQ